MELDHRKAAITRLGSELRTLVEATVRTAATPDTLHRVADAVREVTALLTGRRRARTEIPEVDEFPTGVRIYSPVTGAGSPLAPPVSVTSTADGLMGRCVLGIAHEGPPGYGHGGMSAMLLDELMGRACAIHGSPGLTVSLQLRYHGPVPLETPLRIVVRVSGTDDRKTHVTGSITTEADPRHGPGHRRRRLRRARSTPCPHAVPQPVGPGRWRSGQPRCAVSTG
ncbi:PaaI family thioesterase [Streptomyces sp. NPDC006739]|uniref:PaaI family thioesterase n=1 Tax=Streptomyces sp. NPDC006739 TaxID=3364763 RepID=UPI0036A8C74E